MTTRITVILAPDEIPQVIAALKQIRTKVEGTTDYVFLCCEIRDMDTLSDGLRTRLREGIGATLGGYATFDTYYDTKHPGTRNVAATARQARLGFIDAWIKNLEAAL